MPVQVLPLNAHTHKGGILYAGHVLSRIKVTSQTPDTLTTRTQRDFQVRGFCTRMVLGVAIYQIPQPYVSHQCARSQLQHISLQHSKQKPSQPSTVTASLTTQHEFSKTQYSHLSHSHPSSHPSHTLKSIHPHTSYLIPHPYSHPNYITHPYYKLVGRALGDVSNGWTYECIRKRT